MFSLHILEREALVQERLALGPKEEGNCWPTLILRAPLVLQLYSIADDWVVSIYDYEQKRGCTIKTTLPFDVSLSTADGPATDYVLMRSTLFAS